MALSDGSIFSRNALTVTNGPTYLRQWNWGAFFLPGLWPLTHGLVWLAVAEWAMGVGEFLLRTQPPGPFEILWVVLLAVSLILGMTGNRIALSNRLFTSDREFVACENAWRNAGFVVFAIYVLLEIMQYGFWGWLHNLTPWT